MFGDFIMFLWPSQNRMCNLQKALNYCLSLGIFRPSYGPTASTKAAAV